MPEENNSMPSPDTDAGAEEAASFDVDSLVADDFGDSAPATPAIDSANKGVAGVEPAAAAPTTTPGAVSPTPVAAAPSTPPAAVAAPAAPTTEQQQGQPPAGAPAPASVEGDLPQQIDFSKHREEFLPKLEKLYAIPENEVELLRTNPEQALPKLAARLHYETQTSVFHAILRTLPDLLQQHTDSVAARNEGNDKFYAKWGKLKEAVGADPSKEAVIKESIRAFRTANPKAGLDDVIAKAGLLAMISLGIPLEDAATNQTPPPAPPPQRPPRPVGVGASMPAATTPTGAPSEKTIFEEMVEDHVRGGNSF